MAQPVACACVCACLCLRLRASACARARACARAQACARRFQSGESRSLFGCIGKVGNRRAGKQISGVTRLAFAARAGHKTLRPTGHAQICSDFVAFAHTIGRRASEGGQSHVFLTQT
ncbi:hypothetical protein BX600DRAFT_432862 [Xylariales sp. PMI_506]|nr:hypothetical protein BX600DRAFT_432862 [Xylariales sp. PMI_506]